jgi:hypothetical protein
MSRAASVSSKMRASYYAPMAQRELLAPFASNGIHVSRQPPAALIIARNSFR